MALRPEALGPRVLMAACFLELKRYENALQSLEEALQIQPDHAPARAYRGIACMRLERYREAREDFTRALRINPRLRPADGWKDWLGQANGAAKNWQEAAQSFEEAIRIRPSGRRYSLLAACYREMGNQPKALAASKQAVGRKAEPLRGTHSSHLAPVGQPLERFL